MTRFEFIAECGERLIDPAVALENEQVVEALRERNDTLVRWLLDAEF